NYSASLLNEVPLQNVVCRQRGSRMAKAALERSGEKLAESADEIKRSSYRVEDSAERTTQLAANRTIFAAERTYAAWVPTGRVAMASGIRAQALLSGLSRNGWSLRRAACLFYSAPSASVQQSGGIFIPAHRRPNPMCHESHHGCSLR